MKLYYLWSRYSQEAFIMDQHDFDKYSSPSDVILMMFYI